MNSKSIFQDPSQEWIKRLEAYPMVLAEGGVLESLRRMPGIQLHEKLEHAPLIYTPIGAQALTEIYANYVAVARQADLPIMLFTPTWRANHARVTASGIADDINEAAVRFVMRLKQAQGNWGKKLLIGGLIGCRNDAYRPDLGLSTDDAHDFHRWQIERLALTEVDFLAAMTLPALPEALGIAKAMARAHKPFVISFVINRQGCLLDGHPLSQAIGEIDAMSPRLPMGYMVNCAFPSFLKAEELPPETKSRIMGYQGNSSSMDQACLNGAASRKMDIIPDWGQRMIHLNRKHGIKILGGCCGTGPEHLQYLVDHWKDEIE